MSPNFMWKQHSTPQNLKNDKQNRKLIIRTQVTVSCNFQAMVDASALSENIQTEFQLVMK